MASAPDSYYSFKFTAPGGDSYSGFFIHDTSWTGTGHSWWSPEGVRVGAPQSYGHYQIVGKQDLGYDLGDRYGNTQAEGTTWITSYYNKETNSILEPYKWTNGKQSAGMIGQEYDHINMSQNSPQAIPLKPQWDDFGFGGGYLAGGTDQGPIPRQNPVGRPLASVDLVQEIDQQAQQHSDYMLG